MIVKLDKENDKIEEEESSSFSDVECINKSKQIIKLTDSSSPLIVSSSNQTKLNIDTNKANCEILELNSSNSFIQLTENNPISTTTVAKKPRKSNYTKPFDHSFNTNDTIESLVAQVRDEIFEKNPRLNSNSGSKSPLGGAASSSSAANSSAETYLIDRYKYAVRHIRQGLSVEEACNKYRISKGALLKCLSGGTAPRGKKTRLSESEENEIVEWLINDKDLKYNDAIHLVFELVEKIFQQAQRPNPFNNGKPR